jgi:predicted nucleic acid-binding protein
MIVVVADTSPLIALLNIRHVEDERKAYREAVHRKLNAIGTIRILERAAAEGLLDLKDAFARLKQTDFWISHKLLDERLKLFEQQGPQRAE